MPKMLVNMPHDFNGCYKCPAEKLCWKNYPISDAPLEKQRQCPIYNAVPVVEVRRGGGVSMEYVKRPRHKREPIFQWDGRPVRLYAELVK